MKEKIQNITNLFVSTFTLLKLIDPSLGQNNYLSISKQDRKALKLYYKLWKMKRFTKSYMWFEIAVVEHAINRNLPTTSAAIEICQACNGEVKIT